MKHATHADHLAPLRRIEGQVGGIIRMVEDERYCVDILTQIRAIRAALKKVEGGVLREHGVAGAFKGGDAGDERAKIDELMQVFTRYSD